MANAVESIIENVHEFLHLFHFLDNFLSAESRFEKEEVISLKIILHVFNLPSISLAKNKIVGLYLVTFMTLDTVTLEAHCFYEDISALIEPRSALQVSIVLLVPARAILSRLMQMNY